MAKYRKKPVVIEARQWDGDLATFEPLISYGVVHQEPGDTALLIPTLEGTMRAEIGDWIIRGVKGELYPIKSDVFDLTYEPVAGDQ